MEDERDYLNLEQVAKVKGVSVEEIKKVIFENRTIVEAVFLFHIFSTVIDKISVTVV
jgi:hypothetical protein